MLRQFLYLTPLVLLCACATPGRDAAIAAGEAPGSSSYGLFLAGEAALNDGRTEDAALYFERARAQGADPELIGQREFTAALLSGNIPRAAALAPVDVDAAEPAKRLGRLVQAVEAMATGKPDAARALLTTENIGFPHSPAAVLLAPWAAAEAGDVEASLVRPALVDDRAVAYFGQLGQAFLYERAKRYEEADASFKALTSGELSGEMVVAAYGEYLERQGRRDEAVKLYDSVLARDLTTSALKAARVRAAKGGPPPPMPTLREGAAQALLVPAATLLSAKQSQLGLAYLRLVLRLDPRRDEAWLLVGDVMTESGDLAAAREAYLRVSADGDQGSAARAKLAWTYQSADEPEAALKLAREAAASGTYEGRLTLADLLRANEKYDESARLLTDLINEAPKPNWRLLYARGVAYEKLGRWPDAEADLIAALGQQPDEPELLNYLGYSWIDRGERLPEAIAMVEKAVAANPRSGAMVDSLGWAHYRLGDYKAAVATLEQAVELEAGDPEINNHLGDAYWRVGRRNEANFQWRRVLTLEPDAKIKADVEAKLASGLGPAGPAVKPKLAGQ